MIAQFTEQVKEELNMKENWKIDRVGKAMSELIFSGMDELTDKNLRRLAAFLLEQSKDYPFMNQ